MGYSSTSLHGLTFIFALLVAIIAIFKRPFFGILIYYTMHILKETLTSKDWEWIYKNYRILFVLAVLTTISWFFHSRSEKGKGTILAPQVLLMFVFLGVACLSRVLARLVPIFDLDTTTLAKHAVMMFISVNVIDSKKKVNLFVWATLLATTYVAFDAYKRYVTLGLTAAKPIWWADKNDFALGLVTFLPLGFGLFWLNKSIFAKVVAGFSAVILAVTVLGTHSRGGFIAMLVILPLMIVFGENRLRKVVLSIPVAFCLLLNYNASITSKLSSVLGYQEEATANERFEAWEAGISMITSNPIFGVGAGNFKYRFADYTANVSLAETNEIRSAHNMFIDVGATTGLIGLSIFLIILFKTFKDVLMVRNLSKSNTDMQYVNELISYIGISLIGFCAAGLFLSQAYNSRLCILITVVVALKRIVKEKFNAKGLQEK